MKPDYQHFSTKVFPSSNHRHVNETGMIAETSLKLFFSLLVSIVASISLARLLPYHFAQLNQLRELRAQTQETKHRVQIKRQQLEKNFDSSQINTLMEEHSPRIDQNRIRVFWQNHSPGDTAREKGQ
jgi:hypothetical protein